MWKTLLISFLEAIDIFSIAPSSLFTYKSKLLYSTLYTKTMTIFVIIISVLGFCYFSWNFIIKQNPLNVLTEEYLKSPSPIQMDRELFLMNFALQNKSDNFLPYLDESIYKPEVFIETRLNNNNMTSLNISVGPCEITDLPINDKELQEYFLLNNYEKMYCFKNYSQIVLNGTWDSEVYKQMHIKIRPCSNESDNIICKTPEIIKKSIEGSFVVMQYTSVILDLNNYEKPFKIFGVNDFQPISLKMANDMYLYFGQVEIDTDVGYIDQEYLSQTGVNLISQKFTVYENTEDSTFINIYLKLDRIRKRISRKYDKLQETLSKVGGLMRFFTFMGYLLLQPFLKEALLQRVSNDIFDYGDFFTENNENLRKSYNNFPSNISATTPKIKLTYWQYIKSKIKTERQFTRKSELLYISVREMKKSLDISKILNKFYEIENLKLTFERNYAKELSNYSKPKLNLIPLYNLSEEGRSEAKISLEKPKFLKTDGNEKYDLNNKKNDKKSTFLRFGSPKHENLIEMTKFIEKRKDDKIEEKIPRTRSRSDILIKKKDRRENKKVSVKNEKNEQKLEEKDENYQEIDNFEKKLDFSVECDFINKKSVFEEKN